MNDHEPVIVGALRTPVGKRGGRLQKWHPVDLMAETLRQLVEQSGVNPSDLDDVIVGCVLQWDQQHGNLARHAVLAAGLPESVPAVTVDRQCGSGQQAVSFAVHGIQAGAYQLAIGGGVESMSQAPLPPSFKPGAPLGSQYSPRELARYQDNPLIPQGVSSELLNTRFGLTRETLDASAVRSHKRATEAIQAGRIKDQLVHLTEDPADPNSPVVAADEGVRANPDPEKMATLKAVFAANGTTTAGNSSQVSDGAAALLIASRAYAKKHGLKPRARFVSTAVAAADPVIQFTAVLDSTRKALKESGLTINDIDLFEVNEAFGGVPLMFQQEFGIPDDRLNVNGGSMAIGHPLGSTGARMLTDLLYELERRGGRYGLQTICEASGTANTTIIERLA